MPLFVMKAFLLAAVVKGKTKLDEHLCFTFGYLLLCAVCVHVCVIVVKSVTWPLNFQLAEGGRNIFTTSVKIIIFFIFCLQPSACPPSLHP